MRIRTHVRLTILAAVVASALAATALAGEPAILYPAKVSTMGGRVIELTSVTHELGEGYFTFYDQNEEGRVAWRDLDKIVFTGNIGYGPGSEGLKVPHTERVRLYYVDGSDRVVSLVIGRISGDDGFKRHDLLPRDISRIDFDEEHIAPTFYMVCERGHQWEQGEYRFCPYDGEPLRKIAVGYAP